MDDNTFVAIGKYQFLYYNLEDYKSEINNYNLNDFNPTNIIKIDKTSFLVWIKWEILFILKKSNRFYSNLD